MRVCDETEIELESLIERIVCKGLDGKSKEFCEDMMKTRYSNLLRCEIPA